MVVEAGIEPARACAQWILNPHCLPIPTLDQETQKESISFGKLRYEIYLPPTSFFLIEKLSYQVSVTS